MGVGVDPRGDGSCMDVFLSSCPVRYTYGYKVGISAVSKIGPWDYFAKHPPPIGYDQNSKSHMHIPRLGAIISQGFKFVPTNPRRSYTTLHTDGRAVIHDPHPPFSSKRVGRNISQLWGGLNPLSIHHRTPLSVPGGDHVRAIYIGHL